MHSSGTSQGQISTSGKLHKSIRSFHVRPKGRTPVRSKARTPARAKDPSMPSLRTNSTHRSVYRVRNEASMGGLSPEQAFIEDSSTRAAMYGNQKEAPMRVPGPEHIFIRNKSTANWLLICMTPYLVQTKDGENLVLQISETQSPTRAKGPCKGLSARLQPEVRAWISIQKWSCQHFSVNGHCTFNKFIRISKNPKNLLFCISIT